MLWPIRIALALIFIPHGLSKFTQTEAMINFFAQSHVPFPHIMVIVVGLIEFLGGICALIAWRPWIKIIAGALLAMVMVGAAIVEFQLGGFGATQLNIALFACALTLALSGFAERKTS